MTYNLNLTIVYTKYPIIRPARLLNIVKYVTILRGFKSCKTNNNVANRIADAAKFTIMKFLVITKLIKYNQVPKSAARLLIIGHFNDEI